MPMIRIVVFLVVIAAAALGVAWIADQGGDVALSWDGWRIETSLPVFALGIALVVVVAIMLWALLRAVLRTPERIRRARHARRQTRGRHAITHGLIAVGTGDVFAARRHADIARRLAHQDPLALLLHAQAAQLEGDRAGAQRAFHALAEREDTRLLGLRGLFVEAQRRDDPLAAVALAEEALKIAPATGWASQAVLGFRCSRGDWDGALAILDNDHAAGLIDPVAYRRQRGVLLTARALDLEATDRDRARDSAMEAVKYAPTLVPAAALAAKYLSELGQARRAMRIIEAAWAAQPHPDLADAYAHVRLGDSARQRLARVEKLAAKAPGDLESALAVARAAIEASEFARARAALAPFLEAPTKRVALLMADLERAEHGDSGKARSWTLRAIHAAHDPAWTADGYVSERWRPISPVTGRLDAFQWLTPVAALPAEGRAIDAAAAPAADLLAPPPESHGERAPGEPAVDAPVSPLPLPPATSAAPAPDAASVNGPAAALPPSTPGLAPPVFRPRRDLDNAPPSATVIPLVRAPDDPGVDEEAPDEALDALGEPSRGQPGGWRGFLSRLVS